MAQRKPNFSGALGCRSPSFRSIMPFPFNSPPPRNSIPHQLHFATGMTVKMPKTVKMDTVLVRAMQEQLQLFVDRFGRQPTAEDPVFFCWHSPTPRPMCELCEAEYEHGIVEAATQAGIDPARALEAAGVDDPLGTLKTTN
jgi:hypothetical protein